MKVSNKEYIEDPKTSTLVKKKIKLLFLVKKMKYYNINWQLFNPIDGDSIFGFTTVEDGIKIHKEDALILYN